MDTRQQRNAGVSSDEWYTPKWILDALGEFDLDPCSPVERPFDTAKVHVTKQQDGLKYDWGGNRVWLNPPYSRVLLEQFIRKMAAHNNGIALLVNRQDNVLWQEVIFPTAASMLFMRNRVKFIHPEGKKSSPFTGSCLVAWGRKNAEILKECGIEGKYVVLNDFDNHLSYADYLQQKEKLENKKSDTIKEIDMQLKKLRTQYEESNKPIQPGAKVRVTYQKGHGEFFTKEGVLLGYWPVDCKLDKSSKGPLCYVVKFPVRIKRYFEVESNDYKIEVIE